MLAIETTETLIATQCTLNRVLNELAALQRVSQEQLQRTQESEREK